MCSSDLWTVSTSVFGFGGNFFGIVLIFILSPKEIARAPLGTEAPAGPFEGAVRTEVFSADKTSLEMRLFFCVPAPDTTAVFSVGTHGQWLEIFDASRCSVYFRQFRT